jgi:hypothetical protein
MKKGGACAPPVPLLFLPSVRIRVLAGRLTTGRGIRLPACPATLLTQRLGAYLFLRLLLPALLRIVLLLFWHLNLGARKSPRIWWESPVSPTVGSIQWARFEIEVFAPPPDRIPFSRRWPGD